MISNALRSAGISSPIASRTIRVHCLPKTTVDKECCIFNVHRPHALALAECRVEVQFYIVLATVGQSLKHRIKLQIMESF